MKILMSARDLRLGSIISLLLILAVSCQLPPPPASPNTDTDGTATAIAAATGTAIMDILQSPPTPTETPLETAVLTNALPGGHLIEYLVTTIGTGPLMTVTYSTGMAAISEEELQTNHFHIQRIRREEQPSGCDVSVYEASYVWFSSAYLTTITVNDEPIAELKVLTGKHGYIFQWPLHAGDKICTTRMGEAGFQFVFGPDMYYHYDSYCYRDPNNCN